MSYDVITGEFAKNQLVHQVVETILNATSTKAAEEPLPHTDPVASDNSNGIYFLCDRCTHQTAR